MTSATAPPLGSSTPVRKGKDIRASVSRNPSRRHPRLLFRLAEVRLLRGLSLGQLSQLTGVTVPALGDLEVGRNRMPTDETLVHLCDALGVTPGHLFTILPPEGGEG